jgi:endonuclease G, mitochondrial
MIPDETFVPLTLERRLAVDRQTRQLLTVVVIVLLVAGGALLRWFHSDNPPEPGGPASTQPADHVPPSPADSSIHLTMGNPSGATADPDHPDNYLMRKPYFALSYNNAKGTPNWVSWCLQKSDLGNSPRGEFYPDTTLPRGFKQVKPSDYTGSGFDRGHMCPAADRNTPESADATFVMTNLIPQSPHCNQRAWADLEDYCRDLVRKKHQTLYIVSGPQGEGGEGSKGREKIIGHAEKVTVPANCWKVILALDDAKGDAGDVNRVSRDSRSIAVVMPNDQSVDNGWARYRTSIKDVEKQTGYNFFDRVPAAVIGPLKERVDNEHIPAGHHNKPED